MGDVNGGGIKLLHDITNSGQNFNLSGHIQRRGRLIKNDQVGPARHSHRGHRALQLPARDLMRIAKADVIGIWQAQTAVKLHTIQLAFSLGPYLMLCRRFGMLINQTVRRVETGRS